ncbi:MAG: MATE family efflux transporter [Lachnospiraceae bacterium]|nr:MATE family efflux transporter [Lachnospiraceae bacterium]
MDNRRKIPLISLFSENRKEAATVLQTAWPAVLESFFVSLAGMIDIMMVSDISSSAVAAIGLTTQPKFIGLAFFIALNVSVSSIVARRRGEKRRDSANSTLMTALLVSLTATVLISLICVFGADRIMELCGSNEDTHELAVAYFRIIMGGMVFNTLSMLINAAQRGAGNTRIAMTTNVTSSIVNVCFNYLLIGGHFGFPALGVHGAALATVMGTVVACVMSILSLRKADGFLSIPHCLKQKIRPSKEPVRAMLKIGSSIFSEQVLMRIGFTATALMAADMGTDAMAAHQVGMNLLGLSFSFGDGLQSTAVALTGRSLGEKNTERANLYGRLCQRCGNLISIVVALVFLLGGRTIFGLFFEEAHIVALGVTLSRIIVVIVLMQIPQVVYMGCLRGAGDVVFTMIASTISVTVVRTAVSFLMCYPMGLGLPGVWCGIIADQLCRLGLTSWRYRTGKWMQYKL